MYDVKKSKNKPRQAQSNANILIGRRKPKDEYEVIGRRKPNEVSKSPWEYKVKKKAEEAQSKQMGQGCPRENKRDIGAHE